ncbi:gibberellin 3-beta-dioxygenase 1-like [Chenopodium quinoa]|uniref:Fe2OG dioxygenase domain-containing protein n=1 Tax=Chenopodium quinoa TaxID=63459 RepID=A0A803N159_CHEQI|nr:gibberellin 3-beta-dioxygenase 1-like [Chenopodium quinoa]
MSLLSNVDKDHPMQHHLIVPIDFSSIKNVPESHIWAQCFEDAKINPDNEKSGALISIPIIDLEDPKALGLIFNACETWGMFQDTNHGVSKELLDQVEFQAKNVFNLPFEQKMKVLRAPDEDTGYGYPRLALFFSNQMWNEGFTITGNSYYHDAKKLWPNDFEGFCEVIFEYQTRMKDLGDKLKSLIFKSLNIPEPEEATPKDHIIALNLNSYPPCPDSTQTMGIGPHTDSLLFTILHQSGNASGLQVYKDEFGWVSVNPHPCALVVNVEDLLHIISNARFPSAIHRALINNKQKQRLSIAYFYGLPLDFEVSPFLDYPNCGGPQFKPIKVKEYASLKLKYLDLAVSFVRKSY